MFSIGFIIALVIVFVIIIGVTIVVTNKAYARKYNEIDPLPEDRERDQ